MRFLKAFVALVVLFTLSLSAEGMMGNKGLKMPKNFRAVPMQKAEILQEGPQKMFCPKCGMTLPMFYKTNHAAKVDGKMQQFCSMYCLIEAMNDGAKVEDIKVVDNTTLKFIPAKDAFYVVGSNKPATMSKVSKYAFGTKEAAEDFAKKFGGKVMSFNEALIIAKKEFEQDKKMVAMRQAKAAKKGEMIYKKRCKPIEKKFNSVAEAKAYVKSSKVCGELKGKPLQALGLYLYKRDK